MRARPARAARAGRRRRGCRARSPRRADAGSAPRPACAAVKASGTSIASGSPADEQRGGVRDPAVARARARSAVEVAGGRPSLRAGAASARRPVARAPRRRRRARARAPRPRTRAGGIEPPGSSASVGGGSSAPGADRVAQAQRDEEVALVDLAPHEPEQRPHRPGRGGERGGGARRVVGDDRSLERREILGALVLGEGGAQRTGLLAVRRRAGEQVDGARELALAQDLARRAVRPASPRRQRGRRVLGRVLRRRPGRAAPRRRSGRRSVRAAASTSSRARPA